MLCLSSCPIYADHSTDAHKKVQTLFQSGQEKTAKDAAWTAPDILKVAVFDNGSQRDSYAEYVWTTLYEYGFKGKKVWVQIVDFEKLVKDNEWVKLGQKTCL